MHVEVFEEKNTDVYNFEMHQKNKMDEWMFRGR